MRNLGRLAMALALWSALVVGERATRAWAEDPPPRDPPGTYAGRDAAWWVGELRGAGTQKVAYEALKVIGPAAIPAIAGVLNHPDPALRGNALGLLRDIAAELRPALEALGQALALGGDAQREQGLLEVIGRLGGDGAPLAEQVAARLSSGAAHLRGVALATLERIGDDTGASVPALRTLVREADDATVAAALRVLTRLGSKAAPAVSDAVALLAPGLNRPVPAGGTYRRGRPRQPEAEAIALLAVVGPVGAEAHAALAALAVSDEQGLASAAAQALASVAQVEPAAAEMLVTLLSDPRASAQRVAVAALARLQPLPPSALTALVRLLGEGPADVASQAAQLLVEAQVDPEVFLAPLLALMEQAPRDGRLHEVLFRLAERSPEALVQAIPPDLPAPSAALVQVLQQQAGRIARSPARGLALDRLVGWLSAVSSEQDLRAAAIEPLVLIAGDGVDLVRRLEPLLAGTHALRSRVAGQVLGRLPGARGMLLSWLGGSDVGRRRSALRAFSAGLEPLSAEEDAGVRALLEAPEADLRADAATLLIGPRGGLRPVFARPEAERVLLARVLVELLGSPMPGRRVMAVTSLSALGLPCAAAVDPLIALLADDDPALDPELVAGALTRVVGSDTRALRSQLLSRLDPTGSELVRAGAALALATLNEELAAVEVALPDLLRAGPWPARWRALGAVRRLGARGAVFEADVRALVAYPHHTVAGEACRALATVAPTSDAARRALAALAADRSKAWRAVAIQPLSAFGGAATQDLLELRKDPELRAHVLNALREMGPVAHDALPTLEEDLRASPGDAMLRSLVEALRR